jgi:cytochrome c-type biogenesis protein CcmE
VKAKHKRLTFVVIGAVIVAAAAALILSALDESVAYFRSPSDIVRDPGLTARRLRLGGLVEDGSVERGAGTAVRFRVTDLEHAVSVRYQGVLPDLFREGQGVVVEGRIEDGVFMADSVLAKHDETYMPPEAAEALKRSGRWQHMRQDLERAGQMPAEARP